MQTRRLPTKTRLILAALCALAPGALQHHTAHADESPAASPDPPPVRPAEGDLQAKARRLWDAIVHDDPALAGDVFFPREPFLRIKDMAEPGSYYDRLRARFEHDVHALHASTPDLDRAVFGSLTLGHRGGYVRVHDEGNHLPYWAARHCRLNYSVGKQQRSLEVRVVIAWEQLWYVIHLSEFH